MTLQKQSLQLLVTFFCSLLFLSGLISILGTTPIYSSPPLFQVIFPYILCAFSIFWVGWSVSKSIIRAILGLVISTVGGIPIVFLLIAPVLVSMFSCCPDLLVIARYGFYDVILWIAFVILAVLLISAYPAWKGIFMGGMAGLVIVSLAEILLVRLGQNNQLVMIKIVFYTPFLWVSADIGRVLRRNVTKNH